jgi:hypothetical protein
MPPTITLTRAHEVIDGCGFHADAGEAHVALTVRAEWTDHWEPREVTGRDLHTGRMWSNAELLELASDRGRRELARAVGAAIEDFVHPEPRCRNTGESCTPTDRGGLVSSEACGEWLCSHRLCPRCDTCEECARREPRRPVGEITVEEDADITW